MARLEDSPHRVKNRVEVELLDGHVRLDLSVPSSQVVVDHLVFQKQVPNLDVLNALLENLLDLAVE